MSSVKKVNTSRKRADIQPSRTGYLGSKNLNFHHQATLDDLTIDLTNLNGYIILFNFVSRRECCYEKIYLFIVFSYLFVLLFSRFNDQQG